MASTSTSASRQPGSSPGQGQTETKAPLIAYNNVLVLLPPREVAHRLNPFRAVHDKAGIRWTAHITLLFPFVADSHLQSTLDILRPLVATVKPFKLTLDGVDRFSKPSGDTVHLTAGKKNKEENDNVQRLWKIVSGACGYKGRPFVPHMTLGQAPNQGRDIEALQFLNQKADSIWESVKGIEWIVGSVAVLKKDDNDGGIMKLHDELFLYDHTDSAFQLAPPCPPVSLVGDDPQWKPINMDQQARPSHQNWSKLSVATYNILHDPAFPISTRIDKLIEDILNADADILCLQEVTDQSMSLLLSSPPIQRVYQHSSRDPAVVLENERNVLVLSKYPFTPKIIDTGTRHKPATIAIFDSPRSGPETESTSLVVVAIHLTAGRAAVPLDQKTRELQGVISYLRSNHPNDDWIVAGDMNWPNEIETTPMKGSNVFEDAVVTLKGTLSGQNSDAGQRQILDFATYDPVHNPLAAQTARESKVGQRYDRIYVKRTENLVICDVEMFGIRDDPASDHWGLKAQLTNPLLEPTPTDNVIPTHGDIEGANCDPVEEEALEPATITQEDLDGLFLKRTWLPDEAQEQDMAKALSILRQVICTSNSDTSATLANNDQTDQPPAATPITSTAPKVLIKLEAVGSYALGVHTNHSDIDCLAVGNISPRTFWLLAQSRIRSQGKRLGPTRPNEDEIVKLRRFVKDAAVQMMELEVLGIKIDLQYCAAARLAERWDDIARLPTDSPLFSLPVASLVTLNAYRDVLTIKRLVPSLPAFRTAHRALKLLLSDRGLVGARFGYLGGFHLTLLLTSIALHLPRSATAPHLVEKFLQTYAEWNWERDVVYPIPSLANRVNYKRTLTKEPMVVLSIEKPHSNLTYHASWNSVTSLSRGFKDAHTILSSGGSWKNICGENPLEEFINGHKAFIKLDVHFWGGDSMKGRAVIGWLESRVVSLLVQLHQTVPEVVARLWPKRLVDEATSETDARDPNGFYLFGLSSSLSQSHAKSESKQTSRSSADIYAALVGCLRSFEHDLHSNARYYDSSDTFISLLHAKRTQLPLKVVVDPFVWSDHGIDRAEEEEDEEDEPPFDADSESQIAQQTDDVASAAGSWDGFQMPSSAQRKRAAAAAKAKSTPHIPAAKLRTSADVYNRLMWDSTGDVSKDGYVIGYEDRFKGVKEMPLTSWKREVEDESFIPFHRVVYFKRLVDGVHIWDRKTKVDMVFGSGVGASL